MIGRNPRDTDDAKIRPKLSGMVFVERKNLINIDISIPQGSVYLHHQMFLT